MTVHSNAADAGRARRRLTPRAWLAAAALALTAAACSADKATSPVAVAPRFSLGLANGATADTLAVGQSVQLSDAALPRRKGKAKATATVWTTSNAAVATVTQSGLVTAVATGTASVSASNNLGSETAAIVVTAAATTTTPPPTTTTTPTGAAAVFGLLGSVPSVSLVQAQGTVWAKYENDFVTYADKHWTAEGASYDNADYYDRAMIYYVWWARTGNATYLDRANQLAVNARSYLESVNYRPQPYLMMIDGVALHALVTGDQRSAQVVGRVTDELLSASWNWMNVVADTTSPSGDNRTQARILSAALDAWYIKAPSAAGNDWATRLRDLLPRILRAQSADGAFRWNNQCYFNKPWMVGMLNDALIRYQTSFEPDSRIPASVKKSVDYMWAKDWNAASQAFPYLEGDCPADGGTNPSPDLNNMAVSGFGFVARQTGDASYFTKGDAIFAGGVNNAWLDGSKQFNQEYTTSYRYLGLRF